MIEEFEDSNIVLDLTLEEGGAIEFFGSEGRLTKGYSLFVTPEGDGNIFELVLSEKDLKAMLQEIKREL